MIACATACASSIWGWVGPAAHSKEEERQKSLVPTFPTRARVSPPTANFSVASCNITTLALLACKESQVYRSGPLGSMSSSFCFASLSSTEALGLQLGQVETTIAMFSPTHLSAYLHVIHDPVRV